MMTVVKDGTSRYLRGMTHEERRRMRGFTETGGGLPPRGTPLTPEEREIFDAIGHPDNIRPDD